MPETATDTATVDSLTEDGLFEVLDTDAAVDELDVRSHPTGFAYVRAPNGNTAEVLAADDGLMVQAVDETDVDLDEQDEVSDVFRGSIVAE